ncbi:hypothetical protein CVO96_19630 [Deinococcus koreensis]|uniref:Uncharacterized protein n=1 Tax=Deinococcus koreensis TaxID=2054903 RepID=A0A2K3US16_9DEIO|nr:hypothetical protein CVO96_19630 [Deinococcus koreensis]
MKAQLDAWATAAGLSRSEMLSQVIEERATATKRKQAATLPLPPGLGVASPGLGDSGPVK